MTNVRDLVPRTIARKEKRPLTEQEIQAAKNLKRIWEDRKRSGKKLVQKKAADALSVTQPMISHYINGTTPLGTVAILNFSIFLGIRPNDIDPRFKFTSLVPGDLPPDAIEVAVGWMTLNAQMQESVRALILSAGTVRSPKTHPL